MDNTLRETSLCIIKRHKNRGRYELYIHARQLRELINNSQFKIIAEDLKSTIPLKKKMLFKSLAYGEMLSKIIKQVNAKFTGSKSDEAAIHSLLQTTNTKLEETIVSLARSDFDSDEQYRTACFDRALEAI